eukprot:scaffold126575_cov67-Attheya_sp.AAC.1
MKAASKGDPDVYLGAKIWRVCLDNRVYSWSLSPTTPFINDYRAELDISPEFDGEEARSFQSQIGVLRWMVELGQVDLITEKKRNQRMHRKREVRRLIYDFTWIQIMQEGLVDEKISDRIIYLSRVR